MVLRLDQDLTIENTRRHPEEEVQMLRGLLASGAKVSADPHRAHFYELENGTRVFYFHVSPVTGHVLLLASWEKDAVALQASS